MSYIEKGKENPCFSYSENLSFRHNISCSWKCLNCNCKWMKSSLWRKSNSLSILLNGIDHQTPFDSYFYKETFTKKTCSDESRIESCLLSHFIPQTRPFPSWLTSMIYIKDWHDVTAINCTFPMTKVKWTIDEVAALFFFFKISRREGSFECFWRIQFISGWICLSMLLNGIDHQTPFD